ncbi:hypothetical protein C8Q72DRAFT_799350 [Fomitopsis betulina]|nr:hypothetical protein C8Q72DRAFT_799350 [Fomitopsis betulina]
MNSTVSKDAKHSERCKNLATHSEVFPDGDLAINNEVVLLTEDSATLELLFQYMYRQPQPDITELPFERLSKLAEAAEKYRVFSAMEICRIMMMAALPDHAIAVLAFGAKHGYSEVYTKAAPHTLEVGPAKAFQYLGHVCFVNWVLYREPYIKALAYARKPPSPGEHLLQRGRFGECDLWRPFQQRVVEAFEMDIPAMNRVNNIFSTASGSIDLSACTQCTKRADAWSAQIIKKVSTLPQFTLTLPDASPGPLIICGEA